MRVVIDTNIFVSSLIKKNSTSAKLLKLWQQGIFDLIISEPVLEEIGEVLARPRIKKLVGLRNEEIEELMALIFEKAVLVHPRHYIKISRDVKDNIFLEAAHAGGADFLVTGDKDLLVLKKIGKTKIMTISDFLNKKMR